MSKSEVKKDLGRVLRIFNQLHNFFSPLKINF